MPPCGISPLPVLAMPWTDTQRAFFLGQASVQQLIATGQTSDSPGTGGFAFARAVADGMLPQTASGWEAAQAWMTASLREMIVGASPGAAAWWRIAVLLNDDGQVLGQTVATLRDQGQITGAQADAFASAATCLGLTVTLNFVTAGSPTIQDRIVVSTTVQNPDGSTEAIGPDDPRFADAVAALPPLPDFGAGPVTRTITTTDGKTITQTSVPSGVGDRVQSGLPGGPTTVPVPKETAEMGAGVIAGAGAGAGAAAAGLSATASISVGIAVLAGVLLFLLLMRKDR